MNPKKELLKNWYSETKNEIKREQISLINITNCFKNNKKVIPTYRIFATSS
jgi:hypothetical protein